MAQSTKASTKSRKKKQATSGTTVMRLAGASLKDARKTLSSPIPAVAGKTIKRSVTIQLELDQEAHEVVGDGGFSALVNDGLRRALQALRLSALIKEYEDKHGEITTEESAAALARARERGKVHR
jgi:hypothetical protein